MDQDLAILHGLGDDPKVKQQGLTKLRGPFGVFRGDGQIKEICNDTITEPKRKTTIK